MRVLATDDDARRQEFVLFGFGGGDALFPSGARIPAIGWGVLLTPTLSFVAWVLTPFVEWLGLPGPVAFLVHAAVSAVAGTAAAVLTVRAVGRRVSPVTPLRYLTSGWRAELNTPRPDPAPATTLRDVTVVWVEDDPAHETTVHLTPRIPFQ